MNLRTNRCAMLSAAAFRMRSSWLCCFLTLVAATAFAATSKPNIVFIIADDLGRNDVGFTGGTEIKTPHLDKLARAGARLDAFYVQPLCSPTRAALLTGRYPMRYGLQVEVVRPLAKYGLPLDERLLPQALKEAGYFTAMFGKWHLGSFDKAYWPNARGFDHWYGHLFGALGYFNHLRDDMHDWYRNGETNRDEGYTTHLLARDAVRVIREQPKTQPLFIYVPFNAVHAPHQVPASYKEPYAHLPEPRRTYAGMAAAMDEAIGQIVAAIEETGRRTNTLFIFTSDNGGPRPGVVSDNGALRAGKGTLYEGGVRVCAFATWDGRIEPGSVVTEPLHIVDWYPTLLKLAGHSSEQKTALDGRDIWPVITAGKKSPHEAILINVTPENGAIRMGDWKLVLNGAPEATNAASATERVELFNLAKDPSEKQNLALAQPDKVKELRTFLNAFAREAVPPKNRK
jgi:arylsulfatase A-like enzyme